jgi:hypothetical protein
VLGACFEQGTSDGTCSITIALAFMSVEKSLLLPRLIYVGDVPVESSYHGSALLFRLLQNYPSDRLMIVEAGGETSRVDRRLKGVPYEVVTPKGYRWLHTRFNRLVSSFFSFRASRIDPKIEVLLQNFAPEAVLTVGHGYSWLTAMAFALRHRLPLHFVVHDDWPNCCSDVSIANWWVKKMFARCYSLATSRLCVSPFMAEEYEERYNITGTVLYPSRAENSLLSEDRPKRLLTDRQQLVGAYAGSINSGGFARLIGRLARALAEVDGKLLIFGPHSAESLRSQGLDMPNIALQGLIPSSELIHRLREESDFLFVPMSFDGAGHSENMRISFPSKIADYTAARVPLLICGPEYCSAVRWALLNHQVAEIVTSESVADLEACLKRFQSTQHRQNLVKAAAVVGDRDFSHHRVQEVFHAALTRGHRSLKSADQ